MASYSGTVIQLVCFGLLVLKDLSKACNMPAVNKCTDILSRSTDANVITDGISAIPTVEQLKKLCGAMGEFKACYKPKAAACTRDVVFSMTFGTIENTIEYLCVEGYKDILKYEHCWNQTQVIEDSTTCHVAQNNMIAALHSRQRAGQLDSSTMRRLWCEILDNTTACMKSGVEARCGEKPGCIMHTMMSRALKGLSALMKCPIPNSCQLHSDGTEHSQGDTHTDHATEVNDVHSDGSSHSHGDVHIDHAGENDGRADPERSGDGGNHAEHTSAYNSVFLLFAYVMYFFVTQKCS